MLALAARLSPSRVAGLLALAFMASSAGASASPTGGEGSPTASGAAAAAVVGAGTCPDPAVVTAILRGVSPGGPNAADPRARGAAREGATVIVDDLGERFRVSVAGQTRVYEDRSRDCPERARIAAVFVLLALTPPEVLVEPHAVPPRQAAPPHSHVKADESAWGYFAAAGRFEGAPALGGQHSFASGGAMVRMALGWSASWGMELGLGVLASHVLTLDGVKAREQRFPAALRLLWRARAETIRCEFDAAAGVSGAWFTTEGDGLSIPDRQSRIDLGFGAGAQARCPVPGRLAPLLSAGIEYLPRSYSFRVDGRGVVGSTPQFRLAMELGISVSLE
jgi:hypothetical protein